MQQSALGAEVAERQDTPHAWGVEAIDFEGDGDCYVTVFYGPDAHDRAVEYAREKYANVTER